MKYLINPKSTGNLFITEEDEMKLNYNCPDSEKSGTGPGSCGGSKDSKEGSDDTDNNFSDRIQSTVDRIVEKTSGSTAARILDLSDNDLDKYMDNLAIRTWKEEIVPSMPKGMNTTSDKLSFISGFKKNYLSEMEGMHGKRSENKLIHKR